MALTDFDEIPKKTMVLFLVIDTSDSMKGLKIGMVNTVIREIIPEIRNISKENADAQIKIAVLEFSSGAHWITANGPIEADKFVWNNLDAVGTTDFGAACRSLCKELLNDKFSTLCDSYYFLPTIFLFSGSDPTDDWRDELARLKKNPWFKFATKAAVAISDDVNNDVLKEFTGTMENVFELKNVKMLMKMIKYMRVWNIYGPELYAGEEGTQQEREILQELNTTLSELRYEIDAATVNDQNDWDTTEKTVHNEDFDELRKEMVILRKEIVALRKDISVFTQKNDIAAVNDDSDVW